MVTLKTIFLPVFSITGPWAIGISEMANKASITQSPAVDPGTYVSYSESCAVIKVFLHSAVLCKKYWTQLRGLCSAQPYFFKHQWDSITVFYTKHQSRLSPMAKNWPCVCTGWNIHLQQIGFIYRENILSLQQLCSHICANSYLLQLSVFAILFCSVRNIYIWFSIVNTHYIKNNVFT